MTINPAKWYTATVDDGVTDGPFDTKSAAMRKAWAVTTRKEGSLGTYRVVNCDGEPTNVVIGKGSDLRGYIEGR